MEIKVDRYPIERVHKYLDMSPTARAVVEELIEYDDAIMSWDKEAKQLRAEVTRLTEERDTLKAGFKDCLIDAAPLFTAPRLEKYEAMLRGDGNT